MVLIGGFPDEDTMIDTRERKLLLISISTPTDEISDTEDFTEVMVYNPKYTTDRKVMLNFSRFYVYGDGAKFATFPILTELNPGEVLVTFDGQMFSREALYRNDDKRLCTFKIPASQSEELQEFIRIFYQVGKPTTSELDTTTAGNIDSTSDNEVHEAELVAAAMQGGSV